MTGYTVRLGDSTDTRLVGGKGANLGALIAARFPVPDGFVVTTEAYRNVIDVAGLAGAGAELLREALPHIEIPERIAGPILAAYVNLGSPPVAVRSSGTAEDLPGVSFAGQHDSFLDVSGADAVLLAVRDCWASLWTVRAVAYRKQFSWPERELALAVVIQRMVKAEWAGVMFTADPVSGRRDRMVLEGIRGLGDALVSGEANGQHCLINKTTGALADGWSELPRPAFTELVALGCDVEKRFGSPQDIEWTFADGHCALVQARPLTALPDDPAGRRPARKRTAKPLGNFGVTADHMPYPPFPMDVSLVYRPALGALLEGIRAAGLAVPPLREVLVEIDDGVVQIVPPRIRPTWQAVWRVPVAVPRLMRLLRTGTAGWNAAADATLVPLAMRLDTEDLSELDEAELLDRARQLVSTLGGLIPSRFGALTGGMAAEEAVKRLLRGAVGRRRADALQAGLMSNVPCVMTAANTDLLRMAATVRGTPELRDVYLTGEPADIPGRLRGSVQGRALLADVDAHLQSNGFRPVAIFSVGLPTLRDEPWIVHGFIKSLAGIPEASGGNAEDRFERAQAELASGRGVRTRLLSPAIDSMLRPARVGAGFRDDTQYLIEMSLAVTRRLLLELGRRLVARGVLADPDDVAYLELDEHGELRLNDARQVVERRRAARAASLDHYTAIPMVLFDPGDNDGRVRGMPASRGRFVGRVRVIRDETEFGTLQSGEVMVCPFTNPTWTPLFSLAGAVVVDSGGTASHAAIVAREVGIPAIMGTGNGTRILTDGQRVLVDADQGIVVPLHAAVMAGAPV